MENFKDIIKDYEFTNDIWEDSYNLLLVHNRNVIANHSRDVAMECIRLAKIFGEDEKKAEVAGLLHDIGGIYSFNERLGISKALGIEILKEEEELPLILHQKISKVMAKEIWGINDNEILNAISCHTTLKKNPSRLDLVLFVADKIKWDQKGEPPYIKEVTDGVNSSLEQGAYEYLDYIMKNKGKLKVIHPWLKEAYQHLKIVENKIDAE